MSNTDWIKPVTFSAAAKLYGICTKPVVIFFLFWLLRIQCKVLDEIKHLFGQFQTVYRNMAGFVKYMEGLAPPRLP